MSIHKSKADELLAKIRNRTQLYTRGVDDQYDGNPKPYKVGTFVMIDSSLQGELILPFGFVKIDACRDYRFNAKYGYLYTNWAKVSYPVDMHVERVIREFENEQEAKEFALKIGKAAECLSVLYEVANLCNHALTAEIKASGDNIDNLLNITSKMDSNVRDHLKTSGTLLKMFAKDA